MGRVLFVVTADLPDGVTPPGGVTSGPRKDYAAIATALSADVLDRGAARVGVVGRVLERVLGIAAAQALAAFRCRHAYDAILTDGEHLGLPLALLLKLARSRVAHVTIGHRISAPKKRHFWRTLRAWSHIDRILLHATIQRHIAIEELGIPAGRLALVPYQVDTDFWDTRATPNTVEDERLVVSAGLELRDYPTLFRAVEGLDARVVVAAASNWSKRRNTALDQPRPANVAITSLDYAGLRALYARAAVVVVPLVETDFQAGVTTILEAMSMGKPVIVTATSGQTDVVVDDSSGDPTANGVYVPVGDVTALRIAISALLDDPARRRRLGDAGRALVERSMRVDQFASRVWSHVQDALRARHAHTPIHETATAGV